jgi:hypothetical protein
LTEVVTGVVSCTSTAPRSATMNGSSGIIESELLCSSRPAPDDCTEQTRRDLESRGCAFRRDRVEDDEVLHCVCSGPRRDMSVSAVLRPRGWRRPRA